MLETQRIIDALNAHYNHLPRAWSLHWNAMFHSRCEGCWQYVRPGDRYYHHRLGMSYHEACAKKLADEQQEA